MSKVANYLQEHLVGEVFASVDARRHFATDDSILAINPALVVYPRNEHDVRKAARFAWQLAERGRVIPITPRGSGTDQSGAAIGNGIIMSFPAHMNRIIEFDGKSGVVAVEPGINYGKLQQALHTHGRFLPPYPASVEYTTLGGAIANNAIGEKTTKYGDTRRYVKSLRVVLANGEIIETKRLSKREVNKKMGLATFEGEIYRAVDALLEEQNDRLARSKPSFEHLGAGYDLWGIRKKDGSLDLTPLFVGSQGTLGIITEATLDTETHNPETTLIAAYFDNLQTAEQVILELKSLSEMPSMIEMVDGRLLEFVEANTPNLLKGVIDRPLPKLVLLVEFDSLNSHTQKRLVKKAEKILNKLEVTHRVENEEQEREQLWKLRECTSAVLTHAEGMAKALPFIEDAIVPVGHLSEYLQAVYTLFDKYQLQPAVWGHAGEANLRIQPFLDLGQVGDRQRAFRLMDDYYNLVISLGGSISAGNGDGRVRGPYLKQMYGDDIYALFQKIKNIFDPHGLLNPGVKVNVSLDDIKPLLRSAYSLQHLFGHLPRS